jgi:hypothetical protein
MSIALATGVSPLIDEDTTWDVAGSPWVISEDAVLQEGVRLTIAPGAEVSLAAGVSLVVRGEIVALGASDSPIRFSGLDGARWGGVVLEDTAIDATFVELDDYVSGSAFSHTVFEGGARALQLFGASPWVHASTFRDNFIDPIGVYAGSALYITDKAAPRVVGCTFEGNATSIPGQGGAVLVDSAQPVFQDNLFTGNSSSYGGALTVEMMWSPIVGNEFHGNDSNWDGGAMALVSASPAVLGNLITDNTSIADGGGVHVCVTCYPHAFPFFIDNTITGNTNQLVGAAGLGSAHLRATFDNNIHDNTMNGEPADFAWHNEDPAAPTWVSSPSISGNYWGTTDSNAIDATIHDGLDDPVLGVVDWFPPAAQPYEGRRLRATITSRKYHFDFDNETMPIFLTVYNPGGSQAVEVSVWMQQGDAPPIPLRAGIAMAGAEVGVEGTVLPMPGNGVFFTELLVPTLPAGLPTQDVTWHVALFDPDSGATLAPLVSSRIDLGVH